MLVIVVPPMLNLQCTVRQEKMYVQNTHAGSEINYTLVLNYQEITLDIPCTILTVHNHCTMYHITD